MLPCQPQSARCLASIAKRPARLTAPPSTGLCRSVWEPVELPDDPDDVQDPLYRLLSKIRVRLYRAGRPNNIMDRGRGEFVKPECELDEPARTHRLLLQMQRPWRILYANASDSIDSMSLVWMSRASCSYGAAGVFYELNTMTVQVAVALISGAGAGIAEGSAAANLQMTLVLFLQFGAFFYIYLGGPSVDRWDNMMMAISFLFEGLGTLFLFVQGMLGEDGAASAQEAAFFVALASMLLPIVELVHPAPVLTPSG